MSAISKPSTTSAGGLQHYVSLDSLRGICACAVVFYHMPTTGRLRELPFFQNSWLFVDFFFVLSGFVIAASYGEKLASGFSIKRFMTLRLGRVYPIHLAVILAFLAMEIVALIVGRDPGARAPFTDTRSLSGLLTNLTLTQIFGFHRTVMWNSPSWSIAAEVWTYLLAAIGLSMTGRRFPLLLAATILAAPLFLASIDGRGLDRTYDLGLVRCMYGFALGMACFLVHRRISGIGIGTTMATMLEAAVGAITFGLVCHATGGRADLLFPPLFAVMILIYARDAGEISKALSLTPFRLLGALSYSIYMLHVFVIGRFMDVVGLAGRIVGIPTVDMIFMHGGMTKALSGSGIMPDALAIACLATIIVASWVTYRLIEIPFRDASRRWAKRIGNDAPEAPKRDAARTTETG